MGKIATEQEAYNIGRKGSISEANKCCTELKATQLGCSVASPSGFANKLVQLSQLSKDYSENELDLLIRNNLTQSLSSFGITPMYGNSNYDDEIAYSSLPIGDTNKNVSFPHGDIYGFRIKYGDIVITDVSIYDSFLRGEPITQAFTIYGNRDVIFPNPIRVNGSETFRIEIDLHA